jgi:thymidine kinase
MIRLALFDPNSFSSFCSGAAAHGVSVVVAGLDGDFRQRPFAAIARLLPLVEEVVRLSAVCSRCGSDAHFSCRTAPLKDAQRAEEEVILVGGAESYRASCRACLPPLPPAHGGEGAR